MKVRLLRPIGRQRGTVFAASALAALLCFEASAVHAAPRKKKRAAPPDTVAPAADKQAPSSEKQAQNLINQAKKLMGAGQYAQACPKFAESQSLAPSSNTLLQLALCHEKEGKTASAHNEFTTVVMQASSPSDATAKTARQHADALLSKLSRLVIKVPSGSDSRGVQVTLDGLPVSPSAWGISNPIDPGSHQVAATAKGNPPWSTTVNITTPGEEKTVEVPGARVVDQPASPETADKSAKLENPFEGETAPPAAEKKEEPPTGSRPALGYVLFGAGLVGAGVGTYYGLRAISLRKDSDDRCVSGCTQEGVDLNNQAKTAAWISDFGIGLGVVGVAIGGYMLLKTPEPPAKTEETKETTFRVVPELTSTRAGVTVGGTW